MTEDQRTYQRAVAASLLGIGLQLAIAVALLFLWLSSNSGVFEAAFWHALGGLPLWLALAIVFQQHKLERIEALEAEQLRRRHGADTSIFETSADDLAVAQRRLTWLYRWLVPAFGLVTSAYLIAVGVLMLQKHGAKWSDVLMVSNPGTGMVVAALIAFVGFSTSRYLAGLAKIPSWQLLRSGAAYLMGVVVVAVLIVLSEALAYAEYKAYFKFLAVIVPSIMILIGVEIALNFILDLYRPRKVGEIPRPAFDSRLLAFLTSPESIAKSISEAINYQFGFEITRSWFWQLLSRVFGWLVLLGVVVLLLISCVVIVEPNQRALVTHFGRLGAAGPLGPGLHLKLPWPLGAVDYYDVSAVRVVTIGKAEAELPKKPKDPMNPGTTNEKVVLWTNTHQEDELDLIVAPDPGGYVEEEESTAPKVPGVPAVIPGVPGVPGAKPAAAPVKAEGDARKAPPVSLLNAEVMVSYRINADKLVDYVQANADAEQIEAKFAKALRNQATWTKLQLEGDKYKPLPNDHVERMERLASQTVSRHLLRHTVDEWIGAASVADAPKIKEEIQKQADEMGLGIEVIQVAIAGIHPPQTVADNFHEVVNAQQKKETAIEMANQEVIRTLVDAAGSVDKADAITARIKAVLDLRAAGAADKQVAEAELKVDELLRKAEGQAGVAIAQAQADRWKRENGERGRARAYEMELSAYRAAPRLYMARKFLAIAVDGYRDARKYVIAADRDKLVIRGQFQEVESGFLVTPTENR